MALGNGKFELSDIWDWLYLRFVGQKAAVTNFEKAVAKLETDAEIRNRQAVKVTAQATVVEARAKRRVDNLNVTSTRLTAQADTQKRRAAKVREVFDLRPYAITTMLDLLHPMYQDTAAYGHFGRTPATKTVGEDTFTTFTWEKTDRAEQLRSAAGL